MTLLRQMWAILAKDLRAELRTREAVSAMALLGVLSLLAFSLALDLRGALARVAAPGVLWVSVVFAGVLGLNRSLEREARDRVLDATLAAPVDSSVIYLGKALGNLLSLLAVEAVLLPLGSVLLGVGLLGPGVLLIALLGSVGYVAVGTLLAALAVNTRAHALALPVLLLPLVVPVLLGAVRATAGLLEGLTLADVSAWVRLLVVYDLVMLAVGALAFGYVLEE